MLSDEKKNITLLQKLAQCVGNDHTKRLHEPWLVKGR